MVIPNFLIIGAQRCGTTWLYQVLRRHPEVFMPEQKELEFFSYPARIAELGMEGYSTQHFPNADKKKAIGEASPSYLWNSDAFERWCKKPADLNPDTPGTVLEYLGAGTRLIATLRSPVDRAISGYLHHIRHGRVRRDSNIVEHGRAGGIVHLGFYYQHLQCWLEKFDEANMHVSIFEEMRADPAASFRSLFRFLEVDETWTSDAITMQFNKGPNTVERDDCVYLAKDDAEGPAAELPDDQLDLVVSADDVAKLREIYRRDVLNLSKMLKKDLSFWLE